MILTKSKSRKTVRKILDEEQINYTPQQADELADALFDMIAAISNRLPSRTPTEADSANRLEQIGRELYEHSEQVLAANKPAERA
jgi:hypothetical protein